MPQSNIYEIINEVLRKVILLDPPTSDKVVCHWPVFQDEFYGFENDLDMAFQHLENNLPDTHEVVEYHLSNDPSLHKGYYGRFTVSLGLKDPLGGSTFVDPLSPAEIYEQNKTSSECVGCHKPTKTKAIFSSMINYCQNCCG